jgi:hypothetical protein
MIRPAEFKEMKILSGKEKNRTLPVTAIFDFLLIIAIFGFLGNFSPINFFPQILQLSLSLNHLSGSLPLTFRNFSRLFSLDLSNCSLTGQAYDLLTNHHAVSFPEIEILALSSNDITGTKPTLLCSASFLKILDLSNNALLYTEISQTVSRV